MTGSAALHGLRVLDFTTYTPGPFGTQILADLGATVLKVEKPGSGDPERISMPGYFRAYNRGKHSVVLDLREEKDRAIALDLVREADVVAEAFRPGVMDKLAMGFEDLCAINPKLIYVSLSGLGSWHEHTMARGHDPEFLARVGALSVTPRPDGVPMYDLPFPAADFAAGMYAVIGILATLLTPDRKAAHIETPVMAAAMAWFFPRLVAELEDGMGRPDPDRHAGVGCFRTRDGGYVTMSAVENHVWGPLARWIGQPELADDPDYSNFIKRMKFGKAINRQIAVTIARYDRCECVEILEEMGVPSAPVNSLEEAIEDPQVRSMALLHTSPNLHCDTPIWGIPIERKVGWPELDQNGAAVRTSGWAGLAQAELRH